ncbi:MAG: rRNA maturation RNase YbeY [bacterium]|nr:rRNA maturation RNase YbeY [bacterium]
MILGLVDRRSQREPAAVLVVAAPWSTLAGLAGAVGPADWLVDVVLVDDEAMAGLNLAYRGAEGPTDVLSFSYLGADGPGEPGVREGARGARRDLWFEPDGGGAGLPLLAGEVVLAPRFIHERCAQRGWAPDREMALLVVHGCLHILGWEHETEADRRAMRDVEAAVLRGFGLPHPLAEGQEP